MRVVKRLPTLKELSIIKRRVVDGTIVVILLESELGYTPKQLRELVDIEFFDTLFVLSRSVGIRPTIWISAVRNEAPPTS